MNPTRLVTIEDAPALAELQRANREFLAPYELPAPRTTAPRTANALWSGRPSPSTGKERYCRT